MQTIAANDHPLGIAKYVKRMFAPLIFRAYTFDVQVFDDPIGCADVERDAAALDANITQFGRAKYDWRVFLPGLSSLIL
jgi:hypothetical protein